MSQLQYSIIVPAYGAENSLILLDNSIRNFFEGKYSYEILYIDDYSADNSWQILKNIKADFLNTTIIRFSKNFGQHAATICGFKHAKGQFIITIDDDLEVHPNEIEKLIQFQKKTNNDLTYGLYKKLNEPILKNVFTKIYKQLSKIEGKDKGKGSSFRLIKSEIAKKIAFNHKQFVFIDELCLWYTNKISFVNVEPNRNFILKNRYKMSGLFSMTSTVIMFSSSFPLKLVTYLGLALSTSNFVIGVFYILRKFLFKTHVQGYTSLIVSVLFSTGLILLCLGIIAQYLSKVLKGVNNAPCYNEDEVIC
jgi:undecaprenyl-phosphate 4-deoxy-4-formamido-L-arabinose transferase